MKLLSDFCSFSRIWEQKGINLILNFCNFRPERYDLMLDFKLFSPVWEQKQINLFLDFWQFSIPRNEFICRLKTIFRNFETRKGLNLLLGSGLYITTNLSPEIVARKLVAVKFIPLQKWPPYDPLSFVREVNGIFGTFWRDQLEGSWGLLNKMTLQPTNTADLQLTHWRTEFTKKSTYEDWSKGCLRSIFGRIRGWIPVFQ